MSTSLPFEPTVDGNLDRLSDLYDSNALTVEHIDAALGYVGRNGEPALLYGLHSEWILPDAAMRFVGPAWSGAEYPDSLLARDEWRELFDSAGYTENGQLVPRPTKPIRLYRGSVRQRCRDWSWTDDLLVAERYAYDHLRGRPAGSVWVCQAPPDRLLARNTERDENEFVVDTDGLTITAHEGVSA